MSPLQQQERQQQREEQDPSSSIIMTTSSCSSSSATPTPSSSLSDLQRISYNNNPSIMVPSSPSSVTRMEQDGDGDSDDYKESDGDGGENNTINSTKDCSSRSSKDEKTVKAMEDSLHSSPQHSQHSQHNRQESRDDVYFFADLGTTTPTEMAMAMAQQQEQQLQLQLQLEEENEQYVSFRNNKASSHQHHVPQKQPFFLLDWLDDLVPEHHDPQDLATLLKSKPPLVRPNSSNKRSNNNVYRRSSSSASCPHVRQDQELQELSPLQRLFSHWNRTITGNTINNKASSTSTSSSMPDLYHPSLVDSPSSPMSSPSLATLPGPGTPKSSNRKPRRSSNSKLPRPFYDDEQDHDLNRVKPTNLALQLEQVADADTADTADATNNAMLKLQLPLCPSMISTAQQQQRQQQQQQLYRMRRAKRNAQKANIPLVQRSLYLAQTWNQKGLDLAAAAAAATATMTTTADANTTTTHSWTRALECWDNALEIYSTLLGPQHPHVANVQNNRGIALGKLQQTPQALQALHAALDIRQRALSRRQQQQSPQQDGDDDCSSSNESNSSSNASHDSSSSSSAASTSSSSPQQQGDADPDPVLVVVSTLHNIANVHQEAGNYSQALQTLVQAKQTLWQQSPTSRDDDNSDDDDERLDHSSDSSSSTDNDNAEKWHQSARLCAAMGNVYYQAQQWKDAREAYQDALHLYQELLLVQEQQHPAQQQQQQLHDELIAVRADLEELDEWYFLQASDKDGGKERAGRRYSHEDDYGEQDNYEDYGDDGLAAVAASAPWYYGPPSKGVPACSTLRIKEEKNNNVYRRRDVHDDEWRSNLVPPISQQQHSR